MAVIVRSAPLAHAMRYENETPKLAHRGGRELIDAARCLLLTGGNTGADANGEPVDTSPHRIKVKRHSVELLLIGSRGGRRDQASRRIAIGLPSQGGREPKSRSGSRRKRASLACRVAG
jgi:hypothetical protein